MNIHDKNLFNYLVSYDDIVKGKNYYLKLGKDYKNMEIIFKDKKYSNINVQNEDGDTFLHIAMKSHNWKLADKLLRLGSDPHILNSKKVNPLQSSLFGKINEFYKRYQEISLNEEFKEKTEGYSENFKITLLRVGLKNHSEFKSILRLQNLLDKNDINDKKIFIDLLCPCNNINTSEKIEAYLSEEKTPAQNSYFLNSLSLRFYDSFLDETIESQFKRLMSQSFDNNEDFHQALLRFVSPSPTLKKENEGLQKMVLFYVVDSWFEQKFDLKKEFGKNGISVEEYMKITINSIFMQAKLKYSLDSELSDIRNDKKFKL